MSRYIARRIVLFVPTMFLVSIMTFTLMRAIPGDAVIAQLEESPRLSAETLEHLRGELGLNDPLWEQYGRWVGGILQGDFGSSFVGGRDISSEFLRRLPYTVELAVIALIISIAVGIPSGATSAFLRGTPLDYVFRLFAVFWLAVPNFWIATMVLVLPLLWFGWAPSIVAHKFSEAPFQHVEDLMIPGVIMGLSSSAISMRMTRSQVLEVLRQDYIRTAYAKGLTSFSVIKGHALKNALIPVVTIWGTQVSGLLNGSVLLETIFGIPGLGQWTVESIRLRDYPVTQALVLFFAFATLTVNLLVDISYSWLDPRIRAG